MNKVLKFNTKDQNVWFTSDLHLKHAKSFIFSARGFNSPQEHTEAVINSVNQNVLQDDNLFFLGDFSLNSSVEETDALFDRLVCQNIYYIWGNHESFTYKIYKREILNRYKEDIEVYPFRYKNIVFIGNYCDIVVDGKKIALSHYPIMDFNYAKEFGYHCHGHCHGGLSSSLPDHKDSKILDVGWDVFSRPISFNEVKEIMNTKQYVSVGHH